MAIDRKDITLALKGENRTQQSFSQATKAVRDLTAAIKEQVDGVRGGKTTLDDLKDTYRELETVGKALASQQGLIDSFRAQTASLATLGTRLDAAKTKAAAFSATLAAGGQRTVEQERRLTELGGKVTKAGDAFAAMQTRLAATSAALAAAGVDMRDLDAASKSLLSSSTQIGAGINTLDVAIRGYGRTMKAVAAEERSSAEATRAKAATIASVNAAMEKARTQQERLLRAVRAAETEAARAALASADATAKETAAVNAQADAVDRLISRRRALNTSSTAEARVRGRGGAEAAVNAVVSPTVGQTNLGNISNELNALSASVAQNLGKPVANYLGILQDLERTLKNVQNVAKQVDGFQAQRAATQQASNTYRDARDRLKLLNDEYRRNPTAANAQSVREATAVYNQASTVFNQQYQTLKVLRAELRAASVDTRNLVAVEKQLVDMTKTVTASIRDLNKNFDQFGGSRREGAAGILGLRPYEIQNLSFQINDFFTQLASGASATQAFAQQIGQVAQIQPIWTRIVAFAPAFIALGTAIGVTTAALARMYETTASNRGFTATLTLLAGGATADGLGVTATQLTRLSRELEALGFDFAEVRKAATTFLQEGLAPANLNAATEAAVRLARVTGKDVPDATRILTTALRGGNEAVVALREAGIALDQRQRDAVIGASALTSEYERQQQVLRALAPIIRQADEEGLSPLTRAINAAKEAWRGLLDELGRSSVFQALAASIDAVISGLTNMRRVGAIVANALTTVFAPVIASMNFLQRVLGALGRAVDLGPAIVVPGEGGGGAPAAGGDGQTPVGGDTAGELRAQRAATRQELELIRDDRRRSRRERETAALRLARIEVDSANEGATAATRSYLAQLRLLEFRQKLDEEANRGGAAEIRRDFQAINTDLQNAIRSRDEAIRGIQEDVAAGASTPVEAIRRIGEAAAQTRPEIQRLRDEAQRFLDSGRGGNDAVRNSAIQRVIAQADRQLSGQTGSRAGVNAILGQSQQDIQRQFQERANFIQTQNALEQQGVQTRAESEARIVSLYGNTREALLANIEAYAQANEAARANGDITEAAAAGNAASVELWRVQLERINPEWARLKQGIENAIGSSAGTFFDSVAKAMGDALAGVTSIGEAFEAAGDAALQFFADVLKGIAQVIAQEQILQLVRIGTKAISASFGAPTAHTGAVVGSPGGAVRSVNPRIFDGAPRMHSGGVVGGLRNDERAAILQTGEEVLRREDKRNIRNAGKGMNGAAAPPVEMTRQVLAVGDDEIANAMNGPAGERVVLSILQRYAPSVRSLVRG